MKHCGLLSNLRMGFLLHYTMDLGCWEMSVNINLYISSRMIKPPSQCKKSRNQNPKSFEAISANSSLISLSAQAQLLFSDLAIFPFSGYILLLPHIVMNTIYTPTMTSILSPPSSSSSSSSFSTPSAEPLFHKTCDNHLHCSGPTLGYRTNLFAISYLLLFYTLFSLLFFPLTNHRASSPFFPISLVQHISTRDTWIIGTVLLGTAAVVLVFLLVWCRRRRRRREEKGKGKEREHGREWGREREEDVVAASPSSSRSGSGSGV